MTKSLLVAAIDASVKAGAAILEVYQTNFAVEHKADRSPLTLADRKSHQIIVDHLKNRGLPILSEEGRHLPFAERKTWDTFWLIDPLDGTKEFVKRNGEFTVNIALIKDHQPVMGVIYAPVDDLLYFGLITDGAYRLSPAAEFWQTLSGGSTAEASLYDALLRSSTILPDPTLHPAAFTMVGSRSHSTPEVDDIRREMQLIHGDVNFISAGSSLKLCMVADGRAHLYPRTGPTMEWDTAAGQAIAEASGALVLEFATQRPLRYNKENLLNPWFVVKRR